MKEIIRMVIYVSLTLGVIVALSKFSSGTGENGSLLGVIAIVAVIVAPIVISMVIVKREKRKEKNTAQS